MCIPNQKIKPTGLQDGSLVHINAYQIFPASPSFQKTKDIQGQSHWQRGMLLVSDAGKKYYLLNTNHLHPYVLKNILISSDVIQCQTIIVVLPRSWQHFAVASLFCTRLSAFNSCKHGETASCPSCPCHLHRPSQLSPLQGPGENVSCDLIRRDEVWTLQIGFFGAGPQIGNQAFEIVMLTLISQTECLLILNVMLHSKHYPILLVMYCPWYTNDLLCDLVSVTEIPHFKSSISVHFLVTSLSWELWSGH